MEKLLLSIGSKKSWITNIFCSYFFLFIFRKYEFFTCLACIANVVYKKILRVFNFVKLTKICEIHEKNIHKKISTLKVDIPRTPIRWRHQKLGII